MLRQRGGGQEFRFDQEFETIVLHSDVRSTSIIAGRLRCYVAPREVKRRLSKSASQTVSEDFDNAIIGKRVDERFGKRVLIGNQSVV